MADRERIRLNFLAILVSAIVYFAVNALWFTFFMKEWLAGNRQTLDQLQDLQQHGHNPLIAYAIAFFGGLVIAVVLSLLTQMTGRQTLIRGVSIAILCWIGFVLTTWSAEYAFEAREMMSTAINTGAPLVGMVFTGAIVGAWKDKSKALAVAV